MPILSNEKVDNTRLIYINLLTTSVREFFWPDRHLPPQWRKTECLHIRIHHDLHESANFMVGFQPRTCADFFASAASTSTSVGRKYFGSIRTCSSHDQVLHTQTIRVRTRGQNVSPGPDNEIIRIYPAGESATCTRRTPAANPQSRFASRFPR